MGNALRNDATRAQFAEPGVGKAGRILGIIGTVYAALLIGFIILMIIGIAAGSSY